jgi:hypothetical protein
MPQPKQTNPILLATLIAGTLDILGAFTQFYLMRKMNPAPVVLKYIASGVFGPDAMKGGAGMMIIGLLFHYLIVLGCVLVFYGLYPRVNIMRVNKWITAVVYALLVWAVTNLVIVPLSLVRRGPFNINNALIAMLILVLMIGIPITFIIGNYFDRRKVADSKI